MNVKELIDRLSSLPKDAEVVVDRDMRCGDGGQCGVNDVRLVLDEDNSNIQVAFIGLFACSHVWRSWETRGKAGSKRIYRKCDKCGVDELYSE